MKIAKFALCLLLVLVAACDDSGADYGPILDGPPTPAFRADLAACQSLARNQRQFDQETAGAAVLGAGAGALLGAADDDAEAAGGAIVGALAGGVAGAVTARERREAIVVECVRGRGHRVVG
ncbi:glycine zipper family protein [Jannaschia sp. M317]|uniref:glycine zipper family protein n=1 Tax=Jannaschia sp. M317 TaxID=2867011 RepID=UPI0021A53142|nr:glycine zipper family protein [Jannaschia sp. M317]UWQ16393.1 glycine zipper family protein [Jannaschia sp. M317]